MLGTLGTLPDWPDLTCADDVIQMAIADLNQSDAMANDSLLNLHQKVEIMRRRLRVEQAHRSLVGSEAAHGTQLGFKNETPLSQTVDSASVVLHFWTPACASCSKDLGTVSHWQEKYGSAGLSVVSISADEQRATLEKLATDRRLRQTLATVPREGPWMTYYAVEFLPQLVLLDRQGRIRAIQVGNNPAKWRRFEQSIRSVLDEAAHRVTASGPEER